jgi:hypothetical protein
MFAGCRARICKGLWSQGIDSEQSIPPYYLAWRAGTINRVVVPARQAGNRCLGSLEGLQIRAQGFAWDAQPLSELIAYSLLLGWSLEVVLSWLLYSR